MPATFSDYRLLQAEVVRVVRQAEAHQLDQLCIACPAWTIRQVVGHMVHTLGSGESDGLPAEAIRDAIWGDNEEKRTAGAELRDDWTNAGVVALGTVSIDELLAEWMRFVDAEPEVGLLLIPDVAVHLQDIAETLGVEAGGRHHNLLGLDRYSHLHLAALQARGVPTVQLLCSDGPERYGDLDSDLIVSGPAYDLCRVMMGRRTPAQAGAVVDWGEAPIDVQRSFPLYGLAVWWQAFTSP